MLQRNNKKRNDLMNIDTKKLEKVLAENKVYDAWQYVQSLMETLDYMSVSYEMLAKVYEHRVNTLNKVQQDIFAEALEAGSSRVTVSDLEKTNLNVGGYELDDVVFLRKTAMEFFHYGRVSMDVLFQITNAALLGDDAIDIEDKRLLAKLLKKLGNTADFSNLLTLMTNNKNNSDFEYMMAFDNYIKHIKTVLVTVSNSFIIGNSNVFQINSFSYGGTTYPAVDALAKIKDIHDYVLTTVDEILDEIMNQVPNCISNSQRIQEIHYKQVYNTKEGKTCLDYISFFVDVPNGISDLPNEIKVYPLIIKPNDEIYSFDFRFDKIFIRKAGTEEDIVGVATLKNGIDTNEFYRIYEVRACQETEYGLYILNFVDTYKSQKLNMNNYAMDGTMLFIGEE